MYINKYLYINKYFFPFGKGCLKLKVVFLLDKYNNLDIRSWAFFLHDSWNYSACHRMVLTITFLFAVITHQTTYNRCLEQDPRIVISGGENENISQESA